MPRKIFVGQLPRSLTSAQLEGLFSPHGEVRSAEVVVDRYSGQSRGFGFVLMATQQATEQAIQTLHGSQVEGHTLKVNEAEDRPRGGSAGHGRPSSRQGRRR